MVLIEVAAARRERVGTVAVGRWRLAIWGVGHYLASTIRSVPASMALWVAARLRSGAVATIILRSIAPAVGVRILGLQTGSWWVRRVEPAVLGIVTWGGCTSNRSPGERLVMSGRAY